MEVSEIFEEIVQGEIGTIIEDQRQDRMQKTKDFKEKKLDSTKIEISDFQILFDIVQNNMYISTQLGQT